MEATACPTATEGEANQGALDTEIKPEERAHSLSAVNTQTLGSIYKEAKGSFRKEGDLGLEKTAVKDLP